MAVISVPQTSSQGATKREAVATIVDQASPQEPDTFVVYAAAIALVSLVFLVGVGLPASIALDNYTAGFGLGAMCAIWGGPGFGVMAGGARMAAWHEANDEDH